MLQKIISQISITIANIHFSITKQKHRLGSDVNTVTFIFI